MQALYATYEPYTKYLHQDMKDLDKKEFITYIVKEVADHMYNENHSMIRKSQVPTGVTILLTVYKMKCKREISII